MFEAQFRLPVTCPECGEEALSDLPLTPVREAIRSRGSLILRSPCHSAKWTATPRELEQIREYLDVAYVNGQMTAESRSCK